MKLREKLFRRRVIYNGKVVKFSADVIKLPDSKEAIREYLELPGAVAILPLLPDGKIILVRQYRYPVKKTTYEIPAGKLDNSKENLISCAQRELREETGFAAGKIKKIFSYYPTPAFGTEMVHIFVAKDLRFCRRISKDKKDKDEFIEIKILPFRIAMKWIESQKIMDSKTIIALLLFEKKLRENKIKW